MSDYIKTVQSMFVELSSNVSEWPEHSGHRVAGADEAGRGPLAGAVFAAAVILPSKYNLPGLNDSKKLSARKRELLYDQIQQEAVAFAITEVSAREIDSINIFRASLQAMHKAVAALGIDPDFIYVDGTHCPVWRWPSAALVKGDARLHCIAAASVLAKVARDRELQKLDDIYPGYGFAKHKGYPTPEHLLALQKLGPCVEHRRSYAPVAAVLYKNNVSRNQSNIQNNNQSHNQSNNQSNNENFLSRTLNEYGTSGSVNTAGNSVNSNSEPSTVDS